MCTEGEFFLWYSRCTKRRGGECNPRRLPPEALERIPEGGRSGAGGTERDTRRVAREAQNGRRARSERTKR